MRIDLLEQVAGTVNGFHVRPEFLYDYERVRPRLIFEALSQGVFYAYNNPIQGEIAEFGTATGMSAFTIAKAMGAYQKVFGEALRRFGLPPKTLFLFDSFQGLPRAENAADAQSPNVVAGRWAAGEFKGLTPEELGALCASTYPKERIRIMNGWFSETLRAIPPQTKFAMVHLDCDLYSSTVEVLDHLFGQKLLADGCALFFDDWNCNRSSPRYGQRRAWGEMTAKHGVKFSDCGDYAVLCHKFLVHVD